jgi:hypothetical protein
VNLLTQGWALRGEAAEGFFGFWLGLTPPAVLAMEPFHTLRSDWYGSDLAFRMAFRFGAPCGVLASLLVAASLFAAALDRFRKRMHRQPVRGRPPPELAVTAPEEEAPTVPPAEPEPPVLLAELDDIPELPLAEEVPPAPPPSGADASFFPPPPLRGGGLG